MEFIYKNWRSFHSFLRKSFNRATSRKMISPQSSDESCCSSTVTEDCINWRTTVATKRPWSSTVSVTRSPPISSPPVISNNAKNSDQDDSLLKPVKADNEQEESQSTADKTFQFSGQKHGRYPHSFQRLSCPPVIKEAPFTDAQVKTDELWQYLIKNIQSQIEVTRAAVRQVHFN